MAFPFMPMTTRILKWKSRNIRDATFAEKNPEQRFVLSSRKIKPESKIKPQSLKKIQSIPRTHNHY